MNTDIKQGLEPSARTDLDLVQHSIALSLKRIADALEASVLTKADAKAVVEDVLKQSTSPATGQVDLRHLFSDGAWDEALERTKDTE